MAKRSPEDPPIEVRDKPVLIQRLLDRRKDQGDAIGRASVFQGLARDVVGRFYEAKSSYATIPFEYKVGDGKVRFDLRSDRGQDYTIELQGLKEVLYVMSGLAAPRIARYGDEQTNTPLHAWGLAKDVEKISKLPVATSADMNGYIELLQLAKDGKAVPMDPQLLVHQRRILASPATVAQKTLKY